MTREEHPQDAKAEAKRWRQTRSKAGLIGGFRRFLSNTLSVRTLRLAHQRAAPVRLLLGAAVGVLWLVLGGAAAWDNIGPRLAGREPATIAPIPAELPAAERVILILSDGVCLIKEGKTCNFAAEGARADIRIVVAQTAFALLALLTLAFGFWTQLLGAVAHALRALGAGHVVVTGEGVEAETLSRDIARRGQKRRKAVVLVRRNASSAELDALAADGVALIAGSPTDSAVLRSGAGARAADRVVAISNADSENLGVAASVLKLRRRSEPGDVLVRLESEALRRDLPARGRLHAADMFSLSEVAARQLLSGVTLFEEAAARGQKRIHLAVVGWDETGQAVAARFLRLMWGLGLEAPRVSVFTREAEAAERQFNVDFPAACGGEFMRADITFTPYDWRGQPDPWDPLNAVAAQREPLTAVLVSWVSDEDTLRCAAVLSGRAGTDAPPLIVRESKEETIAITLETEKGARVIPFAQPRKVLSSGALVDRASDEAARRLHAGYIETCVLYQHGEAYAAALRKGDTFGARFSRMMRKPEAAEGDVGALEKEYAETFGDDALAQLRSRLARRLLAQGAFTPAPDRPAQRPWDELSEVYISANRTSADHAVIKLWGLGWRPAKNGERGELPSFGPEDVPDAATALEHRRWSADMLMSGWRRGDKRDDVAMRHPDLRELSEFQGADLANAKIKDRDPWFAAPSVAAPTNPRLFVRR